MKYCPRTSLKPYAWQKQYCMWQILYPVLGYPWPKCTWPDTLHCVVEHWFSYHIHYRLKLQLCTAGQKLQWNVAEVVLSAEVHYLPFLGSIHFTTKGLGCVFFFKLILDISLNLFIYNMYIHLLGGQWASKWKGAGPLLRLLGWRSDDRK